MSEQTDPTPVEPTSATEATEAVDPGTTAPTTTDVPADVASSSPNPVESSVDKTDDATPGTPDQPAQDTPADTASNPVDQVIEAASDTSPADFRNQQASLAQAQGISGDQAVPEVRPQAFQETVNTVSPLSARIAAESPVDTSKAMPLSAYEAANDPARKEATAAQALPQVPLPASVIRVTGGINRGRLAAVLRIVSYVSTDALVASQSRQPALINHEGIPAEIEVSFRGDDRDGERAILNLVDTESPEYALYEIVPGGFTGRAASVAGAV